MLCQTVISPVLGGMTITGTGVVVGCHWQPPPVLLFGRQGGQAQLVPARLYGFL